MREAQRKRAEATSNANSRAASPARADSSASEKPPPPPRFAGKAPDMAAAQASVQAASQKAGAYLSSWGAWATEKKKGWADGRAGTDGVGRENVSGSRGSRDKSPTRLARWNSSASLGGRKVVKEEKGGDGIGRLDA